MGVFDLFSKRQKRARGEVPDVFVYDVLPDKLRVQIVHIIRDTIGQDIYGSEYALTAYKEVKKILCKEHGLFQLVKHPSLPNDDVLRYFFELDSTELALDVVEVCFRYISVIIEQSAPYKNCTHRELEPEDAIDELNARFKENGIGYQFESNELIRVDSEFVHAEVVKPALVVLRGKEFKGANAEFLLAHEHYRHGRYKECLVDCLKAMESTMKAICALRGWAVKPGDTAKNLIATCISGGLVPQFVETQFSSLRSLLESGVPTVRNKLGGHGQGAAVVVVPEYICRYGLNLTASTVLFLIEAHEATK